MTTTTRSVRHRAARLASWRNGWMDDGPARPGSTEGRKLEGDTRRPTGCETESRVCSLQIRNDSLRSSALPGDASPASPVLSARVRVCVYGETSSSQSFRCAFRTSPDRVVGRPAIQRAGYPSGLVEKPLGQACSCRDIRLDDRNNKGDKSSHCVTFRVGFR